MKKRKKETASRQIKANALFMITIMIVAQIAFVVMLSPGVEAQEKLISKAANLFKKALTRQKENTIKEMCKKPWEFNCIFTVLSVGFAFVDAISLSYGEDDDLIGRCSPESKLAVSRCSSCNDDPYRLCTKERCEKLGACKAVKTEREDNFECVEGVCEEEGYVKINYIKASWQGNYKEENKGIIDIGTLPYNLENLTLEIKTDLHAQCKYIVDVKDSPYESTAMSSFDFGVGYPKEQSVEVLLSADIARGEEHTIYIKCLSSCGLPHPAEFNDYYVKFAFEKVPDEEPPTITYIDPDPEYVYSSERKELKVSFKLSEQGYCKYSTRVEELTTEWHEMYKFETGTVTETSGRHPLYNTGNVSVKKAWCNIRNAECWPLTYKKECAECFMILDLTKGYDEFNTSLFNWDDLKGEKQTKEEAEKEFLGVIKMYSFMIRCADLGRDGVPQPEEPEKPKEEGGDNIMLEENAESYFFKTADPYNITIIKPAKDEKVDEKEISIEVNTSRKTTCRYSIDNEKAWVDMSEIDDDYFVKLHTGKVEENITASLSGTQHTLYVKCMDGMDLLDKAERKFYVIADASAPIIVRAYHTADFGDGLLTIITNEEATCVYNTKPTTECNFEFDQGSGIMSVDEKRVEHATDWASGRTYYIKCEDWKGNRPPASSCTMIVHPYSVVR